MKVTEKFNILDNAENAALPPVNPRTPGSKIYRREKIMDQMTDIEKYKEHYSESSFWEKVKNSALAAGRELIEKCLWLFYAIMDKDTPTKSKWIIAGALGYFISPIDLIPDFIPVIGYTDDLAVVVAAIVTVASHIKDVHKEMAANKLKEWFG
jgi:uncharacterized membrane protein YkvA (DUF1232 family)